MASFLMTCIGWENKKSVGEGRNKKETDTYIALDVFPINPQGSNAVVTV